MSDHNQERIEALKQTYSHLAFLHQMLLSTQFYLEELQTADAVTKFITSMANKIAEEITSLQPQPESQKTEEPQTSEASHA